jgi:hypothetical protein
VVNLWCHHAAFPGHWVPGNGYDQVLPSAFRNFTDLSVLIAGSVSSGSIGRLGIVVHGDEGALQTGATGENLVTPERLGRDADLRARVSDIAQCLRSDAEVSFYSCSAGASARGSRLLCELSRLWPGRTVVGSITKGYRFGTLTAADLRDTLLTVIQQLRGADEFYIPGQPVASGRSSFHLPVTLPNFLTVVATLKKARNGTLVQMASGPGIFSQFELRYPVATRALILAHPGQMIGASQPDRPMPAESDRQFFSRFLVNVDFPPNYGREWLLGASQAFRGRY